MTTSRRPTSRRRGLKRTSTSALTYVASVQLERTIARARRRGQTSVVVVGARRSGHHAVLQWLANAAESTAISWRDLEPDKVSASASGRTVHLNNVVLGRRSSDNLSYVRFALQIPRATHLFVNFEDVEPSAVDRTSWPVKKPDLKVVVTRSTLNLIASRLERARGRADSFGFPIDERFLRRLLASSSVPSGWVVVHFDSWLTNENGYRAAILRECGLDSDIDPPVSPFGQGSSFVGKKETPTAAELTNRYRQITWPDHLVDVLLREEYEVLLTGTELEFLRSLTG